MGGLRPAMRKNASAKTNSTTKIKNITLAMEANATEIPVNPKRPAIIERMNKVMTRPNIKTP